jgi:hypothetical protein
MPKKKVKPPRCDGRFEYKAEIGRKFDGKPIRKAFYSYESLADAKQQAEDYKINKKAAELNGSVTDIIKIIGFKDFCLKYIEKYVEGSVEDNTSYETKCRAEKHLIPYFNNILLRQLTNEDIQDFFISKNIIDLSSAVKIKLKQFLKCMFEKAVELKYCTTNPAAKIKLGKYKTVVKKRSIFRR